MDGFFWKIVKMAGDTVSHFCRHGEKGENQVRVVFPLTLARGRWDALNASSIYLHFHRTFSILLHYELWKKSVRRSDH